ncbi:phosphonate transport system permease protein [Curtobacterium sp. AG1037]|uniref:phosphonate ABC transporter, permease protein PhnE n=1 Tax=Curtobacterium sp. AG1037 TaxID=2183990 RepID=UPI000E0A99BB|nr:phosphonate ABC transporter, permease protein PhnE [Curtobacterium sp. AG1037]RDH95526.1 phosphonate transport system permease protein [Curtobacterium sp. AG1037]
MSVAVGPTPTRPGSGTGREARPTTARPTRPRRVGRALVAVAVVAVVAAASLGVDLDWGALPALPAKSAHLLGLMFLPPAWSALPDALSATLLSVAMAWFGTVLGAVVSLPLSLLATDRLAPAVVRVPLRAVFAVLRAVPEVVIAVLMLSVTGLTAWTGALAIAIGSVGTLGKWGYEAFESVDRGPVEATTAVGASRWQVMRWGVWPSARPDVLAFWLYRFEINVRASAILGLIGAGGIGKMLVDNVQFRVWDVVGMLLLVIVVVTMAIDQLSGAVRTRIITGRWGFPLVGTIRRGHGTRRTRRVEP